MRVCLDDKNLTPGVVAEASCEPDNDIYNLRTSFGSFAPSSFSYNKVKAVNNLFTRVTAFVASDVPFIRRGGGPRRCHSGQRGGQTSYVHEAILQELETFSASPQLTKLVRELFCPFQSNAHFIHFGLKKHGPGVAKDVRKKSTRKTSRWEGTRERLDLHWRWYCW